MKTFDAWHLPQLTTDALTTNQHPLGDLIVRAPVLSAAQLEQVIEDIASARDSIVRTTAVEEIVAAIDAAARDLANEESEEGAAARELLPLVTGYSIATVEDVLQHMVRDWSRASLERLLAVEIGGRMARGPRIVYHVFSGNVPGVAVTAIIRSLLVKAATLGKTASGEPVLPVLFARALARHAPDLARCLAVTYWPGGMDALEDIALAAADTVVIYGGEEAVRSIRARTPIEARLVVHGPKQSFGVVGRDADLSIAPAIARATAAYDQQGCVSPHAVYVETGGALEPLALAQAIADELARLATSQPRRKLAAAEAIAIRDARTRAELGDAVVLGSEDTSYTVILDEDPALTTSCLNRTLYVKPIANAADLTAVLTPHRGLLQSVALAGFETSKAEAIGVALADCGVTRITTFEDLPWPPMWWQHDGQGPLRELLSGHDMGP